MMERERDPFGGRRRRTPAESVPPVQGIERTKSTLDSRPDRVPRGSERERVIIQEQKKLLKELVVTAGAGQVAATGQAVADEIVIEARDANGDAVPGARVRVQAAGGGSVETMELITKVYDAARDKYGARAVAVIPAGHWTPGLAGGDTLELSSHGVRGRIGVRVATRMDLVRRPPAYVERGERVQPDVQVRVRDAAGKAVAGVWVTFEVTEGDGAFDNGAVERRVQTDNDGIASSPAWTIGHEPLHALKVTTGSLSKSVVVRADQRPERLA